MTNKQTMLLEYIILVSYVLLCNLILGFLGYSVSIIFTISQFLFIGLIVILNNPKIDNK